MDESIPAELETRLREFATTVGTANDYARFSDTFDKRLKHLMCVAQVAANDAARAANDDEIPAELRKLHGIVAQRYLMIAIHMSSLLVTLETVEAGTMSMAWEGLPHFNIDEDGDVLDWENPDQ